MMSHGTKNALGPPGGPRTKLRRTVCSALLLLASCLAAVAFSALGVTPARADTVPPAPSGWNTVFSDNFAGAAGSAPSAQNWFYSTTTGTGGTQNLNISGSGRYIRMSGTARATQYGYSLWEFQVNASS